MSTRTVVMEIDNTTEAAVGVSLYWEGDTGTCGCRTPQEVVVRDHDRHDNNASYYIEAMPGSQMMDCCTSTWTTAEHLHWNPPAPPFDVNTAPAHTKMAVDLAKRINGEQITYGEMKVRAQELADALIAEASTTAKPFGGVCTTCFTDVHLVGGVLEHVDKRTCTTNAIMLSE